MKKIVSVLFMIAVCIIPFNNLAIAKTASSSAQAKAAPLQFYQTFNFGKTQTLDHLGSFMYGGVEYNLYGTYPTVSSVIPSTGTIYEFSGECYTAGPEAEFPNVTSVDIYIYSSNGNFHYNGSVYF